MFEALLLVVMVSGAPQQSPPDLTTIIERVVRLSELNRRKIELDGQLIALRQVYGENHTQVLTAKAQLADIDLALLRESFQSRMSDAARLESRREALENEQAKLLVKLAPGHASVRAKASEIDALTDQIRVLASAALAGGMEAALLERTARAPAHLEAFLDLARAYSMAGRPADAERQLTAAIAVLRARTPGR